MRWAVIGDKGMFGADMLASLLERGESVDGFNRSNLNLSISIDELAKRLANYDAVVNAVAYTNVDLAEDQPDQAMNVNGVIAGKIAGACHLTQSRFLQISTDYVFDGKNKHKYKTSDHAHPINVYGSSKLLGEELVSESHSDFSIIRTAWLYGVNGNSFPNSIAKRLIQDGVVSVVNDEYGQPTWTRDLADQVYNVATMKSMPRIVHATSGGVATRFEHALAVARSLNIDESAIQEISREQYISPAQRPQWSVLDNSSELTQPIGDWLERWLVAADEVLQLG